MAGILPLFMIENKAYFQEKISPAGSSQSQETPTRRQILTSKIGDIIDKNFSENLKEEKWADKRRDILYFLLCRESNIKLEEESWKITSEKVTEKLKKFKSLSEGVQISVLKGNIIFDYACIRKDGKVRRDEEDGFYTQIKSQADDSSPGLRWLTKEEGFGAESDIDEDFDEEKETVVASEKTLSGEKAHKEIPKYFIKLPKDNPNFTEIDYLGFNPNLRDSIVNSLGIKKIAQLYSLWGEELLSESPNFNGKQLACIYEKIEDFHQTIIEAKKETMDEVITFPFPKKEAEAVRERETPIMAKAEKEIASETIVFPFSQDKREAIEIKKEVKLSKEKVIKIPKTKREKVGEVKLVFGPIDSPIPSLGSFFGGKRELFAPTKILSEIGLTVNTRCLHQVLQEIFDGRDGEIPLYLYTSPGLARGKCLGVFGIRKQDKEAFLEQAMAKKEKIMKIVEKKPVKPKIEKNKPFYVKEVEDLLKGSEITLDAGKIKEIGKWFAKGEEIGFKFNRESKILFIEFYFKPEPAKPIKQMEKINMIEEERQVSKSKKDKIPVILKVEESQELLEKSMKSFKGFL